MALPADGARYRAIATNDIDEQSSLLTGWNQTYDQISAGRFFGSFREATLNDLHLFQEVTNAALFQSGSLRQDLLAIGLPLASGGRASFCGQAVDGPKLLLFSGQNGFEFCSPPGLDIMGIVLPRQSILACLREEERLQFARAVRSPSLMSISAEQAGRLRELLLAMFTIGKQAQAEHRTAEPMRNDLREALADAILPWAAPEQLPSSRRLRLVRDVRALAGEDRPEGPLTIEEVCRQFSVSRRTLQYCFNDVMGMAPAAYLRIVRLNGARRSLKAGSSVTDAATASGFWHLGRFARDYRALFGERPSVTASSIPAPLRAAPAGG